MGSGGRLIGRDSERKRVAAVLAEAVAGRPSALLVAGEPGIGKTSLVSEVTSGPAASEQRVLWGRCLRFGAESSPYLPFVQILTQWHRQADSAERARVLTGAEQLTMLVPALGGDPSGTIDTTRVLPLLAIVLDRIADYRPLALVVDDVQWADGTSLDLLAYLIAGFADGQRLGLLITYRDTDLGEGHRLHGWLADVLRLPAVSRLRLDRLGHADTEELVASLAGTGGTEDLADIVTRSRGNPYYTELLVGAGSSGADDELDGTLREALLGSWHRLDADARGLLQLLAVGGRPVSLELLEHLVGTRGGAPHRVASSLAEAVAVGLVTVSAEGEAWFHHPLIAEVVATTLTAGSLQRIHQEYVTVLQTATELPRASRAAHLALHHHGAGNLDEAFAWSLRAADAAAEVRAYAEVWDHLHRACQLWEEVSEGARAAAGDRIDLWQRASDSAWSAGEYLPAIHLREQALAATDPELDPVRAVRLQLPLLGWREVCGLDPHTRVEAFQPLVDLTGRLCPGTAEHALALARLSFTEYWNNQSENAARHSAAAVAIARRTGSAEALAWALSVRSLSRRPLDALADVLQAVALSREAGDPETLAKAAQSSANVFERLGRRADAAEILLETFRRLLETSSLHDAMVAEPPFATGLLIDIGRWDEAREVLRELLSRRHSPGAAADVRGAAAWLAFRSGDVRVGRAHLDRARELAPDQWGAGQLLAYVAVEGYWACGELRRALAAVTHLMLEEVRLDPTSADELLAIGARVAADLAEQLGSQAEASSLLDELESRRGTGHDWFVPTVPDDVLHPAWGALFRAERARCHGSPHAVPQWRAAVAACHDAGLLWEEARASYQLARALLREHGSRREAASALRQAARIAGELGAGPILGDAEAVARQAHLSLAEPAPTEADTDEPRLEPLTAREREVLSHVVAGRTYAEIAEALFISEKTVSVHVSNLLRKTGTSNRIELAELARRGSWVNEGSGADPSPA